MNAPKTLYWAVGQQLELKIVTKTKKAAEEDTIRLTFVSEGALFLFYPIAAKSLLDGWI